MCLCINLHALHTRSTFTSTAAPASSYLLTCLACLTAMSVVPSAEAVNAFLSMNPNDLVKLALQQFAQFQQLRQDSRQHVSYTHFFHLTY